MVFAEARSRPGVASFGPFRELDWLPFRLNQSDRTSCDYFKEPIMSNSISKHRLAAFKRQKGRCYYCGLPMWLKQPRELAARFRISEGALSRLRCTAEHLLARKDGGADSGDNIVAACLFCNKTRHRISSQPDPIRYREHVRHRLRAGKWHPRSVRNSVSLTT